MEKITGESAALRPLYSAGAGQGRKTGEWRWD